MEKSHPSLCTEIRAKRFGCDTYLETSLDDLHHSFAPNHTQFMACLIAGAQTLLHVSQQGVWFLIPSPSLEQDFLMSSAVCERVEPSGSDGAQASFPARAGGLWRSANQSPTTYLLAIC